MKGGERKERRKKRLEGRNFKKYSGNGRNIKIKKRERD